MADLCALAWLYIVSGVCQALSLESTFSNGDSACGLESRIAAPRCVDRPPSLISLRGLQSHDSSHTILESQSGVVQGGGTQAGFFRNLRILEESQAGCEDSAQSLESIFENAEAPSSRADEALFPSLRASVASVAIHSLESTFEKVDSRSEVQSLNNSAQDSREMVAA